MDAAVTRELLTSMSNSIQASLDHLSSIMEICANKPYKSHKAEQTIRTAKCLIENDFKLREGALKLFEIETRLQAAPSAATQALARAQVNYVAADDAYNAAVANHATTRSDEAYMLVSRTRRKRANADSEREQALVAWCRSG